MSEPVRVFDEGDKFTLTSIPGVHFTVVNVEGAEVELVDQDRQPWDMEAGPHSADVYPADYGPAHEFHYNEIMWAVKVGSE